MFDRLKEQVQIQFAKMVCMGTLLVVEMEKNELFESYLGAMPEEERQPHNCNCCRSFLNHYGNIVVINEGVVHTLWDFDVPDEEELDVYADVPKALRDLVLSKEINGVFLSAVEDLGTDYNHQRNDDGSIKKWTHFSLVLPSSLLYRGTKTLDTVKGQETATKNVAERSLRELTVDAVKTVLELIAENNLYRGKEFEEALSAFLLQKKAFDKLKGKTAKKLYVWSHYQEIGKLRNSAIGQLLVDLSEDIPLEKAVRAHEIRFAPANYRRPTALVTASMVEKLKAAISELGYADSLARRHAVSTDIPVNNLLYVDRDRKKNDPFSAMAEETPVNPKSFARAREVSLDEFINQVLPEATRVEFLLQPHSQAHFMSLIAPVDAEAPSMFSWGNGISWSYHNNQTDVIKEKVKLAGGSVDGELRISLEWFNYDDLDLHVIEPGGNRIWFRDTISRRSGGNLDVDMNRGVGTTREPVENITFPDRNRILEGNYQVLVNNYSKRENENFGFNVQVECQGQGQVYNVGLTTATSTGQTVTACTFRYSHEQGVTHFKSGLDETVGRREANGLVTSRFHPVSMITFSPNHWVAKGKGNQHLFFILKDAKATAPLRPFFNEFFRSELTEHRKSLEVLSSKLMIQPDGDQLSGVGYSLTQNEQVILRVNGTPLKVNL